MGMVKRQASKKNYTYYDYIFEKTTVRYVVMDDTRNTFMLLLPNGMEEMVKDTYRTVQIDDGGYPDHRDWFPGSLVHLHLSHHMNSMYDSSFKFGESIKMLKFDKQEHLREDNADVIKTYVAADEGYSVCHELTHYDGENGFEVKCTFYNHTERTLTLEMISGASLDGLCPFQDDDSSENLVLHHFKAGWSIEGKHIAEPLPRLNLEKSWGGSFESEKIYSVGSKTVGREHPYVAVEDTERNCTWAIKLKHNATWQIELTRYGIDLSLSAGIGDLQTGAWCKNVAAGEDFETPTAYIAVSRGGIDEVSNDMIDMSTRDIEAYGEEGMPIIFNEWCTHWGDTSHEKAIKLAQKLQASKVKYFVVDDGWEQHVGDWKVDKSKFPDGLRAFADEIRAMGMIPGIWMEFESVRCDAERSAEKYDHLFLKKGGITIKSAICNVVPSKFLDFRNPEVIDYLTETVIEFLRENHIGYLKVDYNANIGLGCDGAESLGEGLRQHMDEVYKFFIKMKKELPDLIIENCASGGGRLEPKMMGVTAMSSFSDANRCFELPVIAANLHYLIPPRQNQIWCVLEDSYDESHMRYTISAGFLGRLCWSGFIDKLNDRQFEMLLQAEAFYEKVSHIIKTGRSRIYRTDLINNRNLQGTQAVVRYSETGEEALVVCHYFENNKELKIQLKEKYQIVDSLYSTKCNVNGDLLTVKGADKCADILYLRQIRS